MMDKALRNVLRTTVSQCRTLLEEEIARVLEGEFGIRVKDRQALIAARMAHLSPEDQRFRDDLLAGLHHIQDTLLSGGTIGPEAIQQLIREIGFTHLNRLCAYKILEQRRLIRQAVSRGINSNGFKFYLADHREDERLWTGGRQDLAYQHFLAWLGESLSAEIGALFAPDDPANRLFPRQAVLDQLLTLINSPELSSVWDEDETIGWIYQYYTPKDLRDRARKESQSPRNSYELAFRNQFYTPRYVVQFLVDNTLGRIWYEMRHGATCLVERCALLVWRKRPVFLAPGEAPPPPFQPDADRQATDLETEFIAHREKKDPRDLTVLDPASGSGHFLLYCFDLLETIYAEAYDDPDLGPALQRDFPDRDRFRREVPRLILRHNLHGIDIDLRSTQIAALALWLRAQRAYQELGLKRDDRPRITRANLVCAEPMPGEVELLDEFVSDLRPRVLGQFVRVIFQKMRLAGEAGSLLRIGSEIREVVAEAKRQWKAGSKEEQLLLWPELRRPKAEQLSLFDVAGISDAAFWDEAEQRVVDALKAYAARAANGDDGGRGYGRRLFADDATRGFAFIDLCRCRFEVVLMNPPFGEPSRASKAYIETAYPRTKNDLYAAFVERGLGCLWPGGLLGAITSRTGFFLTSLQKWREEILLAEARPTVFADLGYGVLDTAMVETAAYCLERA